MLEVSTTRSRIHDLAENEDMLRIDAKFAAWDSEKMLKSLGNDIRMYRPSWETVLPEPFIKGLAPF
jgi:hypothetical protein